MGPIGKVLPLPTPVEIAERTDGNGSDDDIGNSPVSSLDKRHAHTHTMSTRRVCWHRNTSISMTEHSLSVRVSVFLLFIVPRSLPRWTGWDRQHEIEPIFRCLNSVLLAPLYPMQFLCIHAIMEVPRYQLLAD